MPLIICKGFAWLLKPSSFLEGLYALQPFGIWASACAKHLGRWSIWRPQAALHQTAPVLIFALLECAQKKPKEGCYVRFKIKPRLLAINHPLANVWCPVLVGKSGMGWTAQVLIEVELMSWWKLEESHCSFWFGLVFLGCLVQSWHFLADGSVVLNFHFHSGPCHTCWADLLSIALETWIPADSKSWQNPKLVPAFWMWCLELRVFPGRAVVSRKFSSWWFELKLIHLDEMLSKMSTLYVSGKSAPTV